MSFATETKNELSRIEPAKKCCMLAEISGFLRVSGSLRLAGGGRFKIVITTENPAVARHYKKLIKEYFQVDTELLVTEAQGLKKGHAYMLSIGPEMRSEQILRETGILLVREGNNYISDGIYDGIIRSKCCRKAYLRGIFMGAGSVNDPSNSYHLEFVCASRTLANDLKKMINSFVDLSAKVVARKDSFIVYMKNSEYISDTLAIMGASSQVFAFEDVRTRKGLSTMRCGSQTVTTQHGQSHWCCGKADCGDSENEAAKGLDWLPEKLRAAAQLRLEHPEASLTQLGEMMEPPMKKSGINNRLRKIDEIAAKL